MLHFILKKVAIGGIRIYQKMLRPVFDQIILSGLGVKSECIHTPSCSEYTIQSIQKFGILKGIQLGIGQLRSCHSLHS